MTNPFTFDDAVAVILTHLREHGRATNSALRDLIGGDEALFVQVRERLILDDLARDKDGVGLLYAALAAKAPEPNARPRLFLSYGRGDDERFVRRLYDDLTARGYQVWFDRVSMPSRRLTFLLEIEDAIRTEVDRLIYVAGPSAATSDYVRKEWRFALELDRTVIPILRLGKHEEVLPGELSLLHCDDFRDDAQYDRQLAKLIANLERPEPPLGALYGVPKLPAHFLARPELLKRVRNALQVDLQTPVVVSGATGVGAQVGLQGMGGIGKSVLAAAVARDAVLRRSYPDGVFWVSVGQTPNVVLLQARLANFLGATEPITDVEQGKSVLGALLAEKAIVLILDDVWDARDVGAFAVLGPRGRTLVTTRNAGILDALKGERIPVELLTEPEALQLLVETAAEAGRDPLPVKELPPAAREVARRCGCLALAIALSGGMARTGATWVEILTAFERAALEEIEQRQLRDADNPHHRTLWMAMLASVEQLGDPEKKKRFAELAVLATDRASPEAAVATLWAHTGGLSSLATGNLLREFSERSLIELDQERTQPGAPTVRRISLHDLLHDCAMGLARRADGIVALHGAMVDAYRTRCPDGWASGPDDGYFFQELVRHLVMAERWDALATVLEDLCYLEVRVAAGQSFALLADFLRAVKALPATHAERRRIQLLSKALGRDLTFIARHAEDYPQALFQSLWNSGWWYDCPDAAWHYDVLEGKSPPWLREGAKLSELLDRWRTEREAKHPGFAWLRARRPPQPWLGSALLNILRGHESDVTSAAFNHDGSRIVSGSTDGTGRIWDAASGNELAVLPAQEGCASAAFSPDGSRIVTTSGGSTVSVWDTTSGNELAVLRGGHWVTSAAFSPDGSRIVSGGSHEVHAWDAGSRRLLAVLDPRETEETAFRAELESWIDGTAIGGALSRDEERVFLQSVLVPDLLDEALSSSKIVALELPSPTPGSALVSGDMRIVLACDDNALRIWDAKSEAVLTVLRGHQDEVMSAVFSPDGARIVSGSRDCTVRVWDAKSGTELTILRGHERNVTSVAFSPDGTRIASGSEDNTVRIWDASAETDLVVVRGHQARVTGVAYNHDGRRIVSGSYDTVRVWDAVTGRELSVLHDAKVSRDPSGGRLVMFRGEQILWGRHDDRVSFWDPASGQAEVLGRGSAHHYHDDSRDREAWYAHILDRESLRMTALNGETRVERTVDGRSRIAWIALQLYFRNVAPDGLSWAGAAGAHLMLVTLEGNWDV